MSNKSFFWCDYCGKKIAIDNTDNLQHYTRPKIQGNLPFLEIESQKKIKTNFNKEKRFYKCKDCGRGLKEVSQNDEAK
jgi:DNA-directed RNA polymerase subunit RPC12/RpoP